MEKRKRTRCPHGKSGKYYCKECKGKGICEHNNYKRTCKECGGKQLCEHKKDKRRCTKCGGEHICQHERYIKECLQCSPDEYLIRLIRRPLARKTGTKATRVQILEYLGCSIEKYMRHLESQFEEGMTWSNHGEWHIDHIVPLEYSTPTRDEVRSRIHYTNTQPLWAHDNIGKRNRYIGTYQPTRRKSRTVKKRRNMTKIRDDRNMREGESGLYMMQ